jgi:Tol biopolymer transport system component
MTNGKGEIMTKARTVLVTAGMIVTSTLTAAFCGGVLAAPAYAAKNEGSILFTSDEGGQKDIWITDGTGKHRLTNDETEDDFAAASPNGKWVVWTRGGFSPESEIWVMNIDGSGKRQLTFNDASDGGVATWSPDGSKIAFRSSRGSADPDNPNHEIYIMNADGTNQHNITNHPAEEVLPDWSPDGKKIAFVSDRGGDFAIYTMATDGRNVRKLTEDSMYAANPRWSPDGKRILFADGFCRTCEEVNDNDLWVMTADGKNPTQVTTSAENELPGDWSRDMKHAVVDYSLVTPDGPPISDLAIVELSNGTVTKLTNTEAISEGHPFLVH